MFNTYMKNQHKSSIKKDHTIYDELVVDYYLHIIQN